MELAISRPRSGATWQRVIAAVLVVVFAVVLVRTAWMSDDAYITLRTVDNLVHGYGLTWNVAERVQSFTHPLWMLVLAAAYSVTREAYFTTIALCMVISLATMAILVLVLARTPLAAAAGGLALILSKGFVDYSTSGLENALTYLLLTCFFAVDLRAARGRRKLFLLSLLTALLALNRTDAVLLVLPSYLLALCRLWPLIRKSPWGPAGLIVLGFVPFLAWEGFSVVYYGFFVPNTALAKLNTGVPALELLKHGLWYLLHSTVMDFFTSLCLLLGVVIVLWKGKAHERAIVVGVLLYLTYVVSIGGDFMSGRFLAAPLFSVVVAVVSTGWLWEPERRKAVMIAVPLLALLGVFAPYSPVWGDRFYPCERDFPIPTGVTDERSCFYPGTGLLRQAPDRATTPNQGLFQAGLKVREQARLVQIWGAVGMLGYAAGPKAHIVDLNALAEPLMARVPMPKGKPWRIGHFERLIPAGYLETLASGQNKLCNPGLRRFYHALRIIIRGPLFTPERFAAIWQMNTGQYDGLLTNYGNPDELATQLCNATTRTEVQFTGGPKLVGYAVDSYQIKPGSTLPVTLYWQRGDDHKVPLASFVHVRSSQPGQPANPHSESGMWAQAEHLQPGGRLTPEYWDGQVYTDQYLIDIPADIPAGVYNFEIGWFNPESGEQLEPKPETVTPPHSILWRSILLPPLTVR